jgi:PAS domain S-box-containing protein
VPAAPRDDEVEQLRRRLAEAEEIIRALRDGEADALVVSGPDGPRVYTLEGADHTYRVLIETMNEGAVTVQDTGVMLYANARFAELLGFPLGELIGQPFAHFVSPADQPLFETLLARGLVDRSSGALTLLSAAGTPLPVQISLRVLHDEGAARGCMIITDMSAAAEASAQLHNLVSEKELLLREIHHRVKNNLQIITSLLRIQARSLGDPRIREALLDSQNRIAVMALVHEQLYHSANLGTIGVGDYFRNLSSSVFRAYADSAGAVRLDCGDMASLTIDPDLAIPLGLIVTELLVNSLKHAFPDGRTGVVQILASVDGDTLIVCVIDDGVGFVTPEGPSPSLGLELVASLVRQIRAEFRFTHSRGTRAELRVPLGQNVGSARRQP